jgi:hypothetical protein
MYGGIDQLVDTYKGNPQPLNAQVQKAQQGQPPGEIPADLEEALALQEIAQLRQGAQNQQAMQAGGAQPSVVEKLRQMLAGNQAQAQMAPPAQGAPAPQGQPVMAARGGSIDQLMSNLGRYYAGGGIVAFKTGDEVEDSEVKKKLQQYTLEQQGADYVARKEAAREAQIRAALEDEVRRQAMVSQIPTGGSQAPVAIDGPQDTELTRNVNNAMAAMPGASAAKGFAGGIRGLMGLIGSLGNREGKPSSEAPSAYTDPEVEKLKRLAAAGAQTGINTNPALQPRPQAEAAAPAAPRPPATNVNPPAAPAAEKLDPNSLRGLTEAYIKGEFGLSPEGERDKAVEFTKKTMGLDALLGEKERRAFEREEMIKQAQANRQPTWIAALQRAGKADPRTGLGGLLAEMGAGNTAAIEAYQAQDLKYQAELAQLRDVITDAKIDGNKELVKQGMAAYKEVDARRRAAATSATSLVNTDENVAMRKQVAKDEAARRAQSSSQHNANMALALEERKRQFNESELRKMREKDVDRANKIETAIAKRTAMIDMSLQGSKLKPEEEAALQARRNAIVKQVQAEYPPVKPEKPSESQFLTAARKANPGVSDADLKAYYKQNYGS